jgi:hypothetical protein
MATVWDSDRKSKLEWFVFATQNLITKLPKTLFAIRFQIANYLARNFAVRFRTAETIHYF